MEWVWIGLLVGIGISVAGFVLDLLFAFSEELLQLAYILMLVGGPLLYLMWLGFTFWHSVIITVLFWLLVAVVGYFEGYFSNRRKQLKPNVPQVSLRDSSRARAPRASSTDSSRALSREEILEQIRQRNRELEKERWGL